MKWKKRKKTVRERTWLAWFETSLSGPGGGNRRDSRRPHATAAAGAGAGVGPPAGMRVPGASCSGRWMREHFFASIGWFAFLRRSTPRKIATFFFLACRSKTRIAPRALLPRALFCRPALDLVSRTPRRRPRRCSCPSCLAPIACAGYPAGPARCARPTCILPSTRAQRPPRGCTTTNSERLAAPIGRRLFPPTLAQICPRRRGIVRRPTPVAFLLQGGASCVRVGRSARAPPSPKTWAQRHPSLTPHPSLLHASTAGLVGGSGPAATLVRSVSGPTLLARSLVGIVLPLCSADSSALLYSSSARSLAASAAPTPPSLLLQHARITDTPAHHSRHLHHTLPYPPILPPPATLPRSEPRHRPPRRSAS